MMRWVFLILGLTYAAPDILFVPPSGDVSLQFLRLLFPIDAAAPPGLISTLMQLLNQGFLFMVALVLGYTTVHSTLGGAIDSMAFGRKFHLWSLVRIVLGTLLLIPAYGGFSSLQAFILWMVINGIGLADSIWTVVVASFLAAQGVGALAENDAGYWSKLSTVMGLPSASQSPGPITSLMLSDACLRLHIVQAGQSVATRQSETQGPSSYQIRKNEDCGPGFKGICYGSLQSPAQCGAYAVNPDISGLSEILLDTAHLIAGGMQAAYHDLYQQAQNQMLYGGVVGLSGCDSATSGACSLSKIHLAASSQYVMATDMLQVQDQADRADKDQAAVLVEHGWATAGYFYTQVLGQPSSFQGSSIQPYLFPHQSPSGVRDFCSGTDSAPENQAYCYLYQSLSTSGSAVLTQTQQLLTQLQHSSALVVSPPSDPLNMVNDPTINLATALMIQDIVYAPSNDLYRGLQSPVIDGMAYGLAKVGAAFTGQNVGSLSVTTGNLMTLAQCVTQAMTGIVVFDAGCQFTGARLPSSVNCTQDAVRNACQLTASSQCLNTAVAYGCISQEPSQMGMLGSFYYNQTHAIGQNPLIVLTSIGKTLVNAGVQSLLKNAQLNMQVMINAGLGLMILKIPLTLMQQITGAWLNSFDRVQQGAFFGITSLKGVMQAFQMSYDLLVFETKFMSELFLSINGLVMGIGVLYGIYFPAVPMIIYTLGAIGWCAVVIEAMVAAPLIAGGVTSPDGGQFLGAAEQGLSLGLSVFLRPSLMVIGLYMASLLAQVSMTVFNYSMLYFLAFILSNFQTQTTMLNIAVMVMLSFVYLYVAFQILSESYAFITVLPDRIMRWFLAGGNESLTGQHVSRELQEIQEPIRAAGERAGATQLPTSPAIRIEPHYISTTILSGSAEAWKAASRREWFSGDAGNQAEEEATVAVLAGEHHTIPVAQPAPMNANNENAGLPQAVPVNTTNENVNTDE